MTQGQQARCPRLGGGKGLPPEGLLTARTSPSCPRSQPAEPVWGAGKQRPSDMYFSNRNRANIRLLLRMGFYGDKDSQEATWGPVNIAGCWAEAAKGMAKWVAADKGHADGGLTGGDH